MVVIYADFLKKIIDKKNRLIRFYIFFFENVACGEMSPTNLLSQIKYLDSSPWHALASNVLADDDTYQGPFDYFFAPENQSNDQSSTLSVRLAGYNFFALHHAKMTIMHLFIAL